MIPHEQFLASSYYGKFFARNLNLYLLQRRPDEWKTMQADRKRAAGGLSGATTSEPTPSQAEKHSLSSTSSAVEKEPKKRKRGTRPDDEIDAVFSASLGKKIKKGAMGGTAPTAQDSKSNEGKDNDLRDVLGAIRAAPKDDKGLGKKKRT